MDLNQCFYCSEPIKLGEERADSPVQSCPLEGETTLLHRGFISTVVANVIIMFLTYSVIAIFEWYILNILTFLIIIL